MFEQFAKLISQIGSGITDVVPFPTNSVSSSSLTFKNLSDLNPIQPSQAFYVINAEFFKSQPCQTSTPTCCEVCATNWKTSIKTT